MLMLIKRLTNDYLEMNSYCFYSNTLTTQRNISMPNHCSIYSRSQVFSSQSSSALDMEIALGKNLFKAARVLYSLDVCVLAGSRLLNFKRNAFEKNNPSTCPRRTHVYNLYLWPSCNYSGRVDNPC